MTATHAKESQENRISNTDFQRLKEFQSSGLIAMDKLNAQMKNTSTDQSTFDRCFSDKLKRFTEIDQSSEGSSTEEEEYSPKSVEEFGLKCRNSSPFVHHQVLKIREEDSHIGEDNIRELRLNNTKDHKLVLIHELTSQQVRDLFFSRPILPSSPLSGKNSIKSFQ